MAGAERRRRLLNQGDGLASGDGPQVSLSSQTSFNGESYCAGHAQGAQCTDSAKSVCRIDTENRGCNDCICSVWRNSFHEYA